MVEGQSLTREKTALTYVMFVIILIVGKFDHTVGALQHHKNRDLFPDLNMMRDNPILYPTILIQVKTRLVRDAVNISKACFFENRKQQHTERMF